MGHRSPTCPLRFRKLVDAETYDKFQRFNQAQYINENPFLKHCPAPNCANVIKAKDLGLKETRCDCGFVFCFQCSREVHFPNTCAQARRRPIFVELRSGDPVLMAWRT